jgi:peptidoglycan/LPS O-acetylase OafA/YrhL
VASRATRYKRCEATLLSRLRRSTSNSSEYIPVIDGLRFLAILPVVLHHQIERVIRIAEQHRLATATDYAFINLFPSGDLGVELFFVISGLIISYPFISAHWRGQRHPSVRNFYLRRVTRLEPSYFLVMIGCYLFLRLTGYIPEETRAFTAGPISLEGSVAASLVYMHGIIFGGYPKLNPSAWSLEIEIQFYILAPVVILAVLELRRLPLIAFGILTLIAGSIVASNLLEIQFGPCHPMLFATLLTKYFHLFLVGILVNLAIFGNWLPQIVPRAVWDAGFIFAIAILYAIDRHRGSMLTTAAQVPCYFVLFIAALEGAFFKRLLSLPWIFTIGGMCYTIYLIHLPILQVLTGMVMRTTGLLSFVPGLFISAVVTLPILSAASIAFFLLVEKPCMDPAWPLRIRNFVSDGKQAAKRYSDGVA